MPSRPAIVAAAIAAAGVALCCYWLFSRGLPNPVKQSPQQIVEFLASDEFSRQSEGQRAAYLEKVRGIQNWQELLDSQRDHLSDGQRANLEQALPSPEKTIDRSAQEYYSLPVDQRKAYLDRYLDNAAQAAARARAAATRPATAPARSTTPPDRRVVMDRFRTEIQSTDPVVRARRSAFTREAVKRRAERGGG